MAEVSIDQTLRAESVKQAVSMINAGKVDKKDVVKTAQFLYTYIKEGSK